MWYFFYSQKYLKGLTLLRFKILLVGLDFNDLLLSQSAHKLESVFLKPLLYLILSLRLSKFIGYTVP